MAVKLGTQDLVGVRLGGVSLGGRSVGSTPVDGVGVTPPEGFVFVTEVEGGVEFYIVDSDGYYLVEPI